MNPINIFFLIFFSSGAHHPLLYAEAFEMCEVIILQVDEVEEDV